MKSENTIIKPKRSFSKEELVTAIQHKKTVRKVRKSVLSMILFIGVVTQIFFNYGRIENIDKPSNNIALDSTIFKDEVVEYTTSYYNDDYYTTNLNDENAFWNSFKEFADKKIKKQNKEI